MIPDGTPGVIMGFQNDEVSSRLSLDRLVDRVHF
jgi:hypothetical protein